MSDSERAGVLIVDDLPEKHLVLRSILDELGEDLVSVHSGREALAQLLAREFAVILLDINMPDIDGLETASLIRGHRRSARTPILFITAHVDEVQAQRGYALGAVDYIPSPVVPQVLRSKVRVFVELYRMNRQMQAHIAQREALAREQAARAAAEQASARADFLADASQMLGRSLDLGETRQTLLALSVPRLAEQAWLADARGEAEPQPLPACLREVVVGMLACETGESCGSSREDVLVRGDTAVLLLHPGRPQAGALVLRAAHDTLPAARLALAREVVSRAAMAMDNARLYAAVRDADRRKNEFLAMLAHELRNPLAPIRNAVHIMQGVPDAPAPLAWARDVISRQAAHMTRLIDDLLDASRIVQGKVAVQLQRMTLASAVERCAESMAPRLAQRQQVLRLDLPDGPITLDGDLVRLTQVLSNLVHNASKFSPPGTAIELQARTEGAELLVSVSDQGCGLEPALLPRIFDLFVQGEQALDRSEGGLGIGLTLVRHLVELHGGRVQAYSPGRGQGTQVVIRLPLLQDLSASLPVAPVGAAQSGGGCGRRVLVVDDQAASTETLTVLLEMEGFEVRVAQEGREALAKAQAFQPDVVLLDIGLPGMSGFEVAAHLRADPACREALLVALTGYGEPESRARSAQAGFDVHMVKPADIDRLLALLADPQAARRTEAA
jgi:signal transduction histidine kinase/DNA-binding response OmpR family regulator